MAGLEDTVVATNIQAFTLNGEDHIAEFENGTITFETTDVDASGARDEDEFPVVTKRKTHLEVDAFVQQTASLIPFIGQAVQLFYDTGAGSYTGEFLVSMGSHSLQRAQAQKQKVTFKSRGRINFA